MRCIKTRTKPIIADKFVLFAGWRVASQCVGGDVRGQLWRGEKDPSCIEVVHSQINETPCGKNSGILPRLAKACFISFWEVNPENRKWERSETTKVCDLQRLFVHIKVHRRVVQGQRNQRTTNNFNRGDRAASQPAVRTPTNDREKTPSGNLGIDM